MDANERNEILRAGIEAAQNGNNITARAHFRRILEQNPEDEQVWLYMVRVVDTKADKQRCLEKVLDINPNNETAKEAAKRLGLTLRSSRGSSSTRDSLDELRRSASSSGDSARTTYSGATGSITTTGTEQRRDWFQPVERETRPPELWRAQQVRPNYLVMGMVAIIAIGFIGLAVLLIINQLNEDEETAQEGTLSQVDIDATGTQAALDSTPTIVVTSTPTPRPTVRLNQPQLPPTSPPELTNTPLPSPTNTRTPNPPSNYRLLFSSSLFPFDGDPYQIFTIMGDGTDLTPLNITLPDVEVLPTAAPTEQTVIDATDVPDEDGENGDAAAEETATAEPEADPTAGRIELIDPSYSPDGQFIVFTGQVGIIQELFIVSATGSGQPRQLTMFSTSQTRDPEWSPDGTRIVFSSNADGDDDIYIVNANATNVVPESAEVTKLTLNDVVVDREPTWSPDSQYIAFQSDRLGGANFQIFVMPVQGSEICQMTSSTGSNMTPDWSPDGSQIVFISSRDGDNDLYVMRSDGTNERSITVGDGSEWQERDPKWSPDREWIVVSSTRVESGAAASVNPTSKLWMLTLDGREWRGVSIGDSNDLDASFLPSGDSVEATDFTFECAAR